MDQIEQTKKQKRLLECPKNDFIDKMFEKKATR
jgi:ABC-type proline/glycine betaine transport system ATPase subunit